MVKKGDGGEINIDTEAWNIADGFTKLKVLVPLIRLDSFENIALYGVEDINEEDNFNSNQIAVKRYRALKRYATTLRMVLGNVKFAIKPNDRYKVEIFKKRVDNIKKYIPGVIKQTENMITHEIIYKIREHNFDIFFNILQEIKDEINRPLNNAGLIFKATEDMDLDKIMKDIAEGG